MLDVNFLSNNAATITPTGTSEGLTNFMTGLYSIATDIQPWTFVIAIFSLVVIGVMFMIPKEKCKEAAKDALPWVIIGAGIILLAVAFAKDLASKFVFAA